jgi:hypothetical protein
MASSSNRNNEDVVRRVVMSKKLASTWLSQQANPEYRIRVYVGNAKNYPSVLKSFRDGKIRIAGVSPIPDLGVKEAADGFWVWSQDREALESLQNFFSRRGLETTWIW